MLDLQTQSFRCQSTCGAGQQNSSRRSGLCSPGGQRAVVLPQPRVCPAHCPQWWSRGQRDRSVFAMLTKSSPHRSPSIATVQRPDCPRGLQNHNTLFVHRKGREKLGEITRATFSGDALALEKTSSVQEELVSTDLHSGAPSSLQFPSMLYIYRDYSAVQKI